MIGSIVRVNNRGLKMRPPLRDLPSHEAVVVGFDDGLSADRLLVQFPFEYRCLHFGETCAGIMFSKRQDCYWLYPNEVDLLRQPIPLSYEEMM